MFGPVKNFVLKRVVEVLTFDLIFHQPSLMKNRNKTGVIVALGDSVTAGFEVKSEERYTTFLESYLLSEGFDHYSIIPQGVSGNKTADGLARIDKALALRPEILILELGGNDFLQGLPVAEVRQNLVKIIELARAQNTEILLVGILATLKYGFGYVWESRQMYRSLAREFDLVFMPHVMRKTLLRKHLMLPDHIHPNGRGYRVVARTMWPYLRRLLK